MCETWILEAAGDPDIAAVVAVCPYLTQQLCLATLALVAHVGDRVDGLHY